MKEERPPKVRGSPLARGAYLYVRQARRGPLAGAGRLQRQDSLRQQAVALGRPAERRIVIDQGLGSRGVSVAARRGLPQSARQVGLGRVGTMTALEPWRWTRNTRDRRRLVEAYALSGVILLDQDRIYHRADSRDCVLGGCGEMLPRSVAGSPDKEWGLAGIANEIRKRWPAIGSEVRFGVSVN